jgi:predicted dehydrogenase
VSCSAPTRYTTFSDTFRAMKKKGELGTISHGIFRFNQPSVQRYIDNGNPWNIVKKESGGGCAANLGIHGVDLCRYLTGEEPKVVGAVTSHLLHKKEVEDYCLIILRTPSGVVFHAESSYTFPANIRRLAAFVYNREGVLHHADEWGHERRGVRDRQT